MISAIYFSDNMFYNKIQVTITERRESMKKKILSLVMAVAMAMTLVTNFAVSAEDTVITAGEVIRLDPSNASPFNNGVFEGWGTSLCWWANRIGYSEKMTQQAAELFFSEDGLGLNIARYNLGGGDDPTHNHINRSDSKVPGVWDTFELTADGSGVKSITYDLSNDQNQLNIAKAALAANPDLYFEGFSNSAPYFMTVTGCTGGGNPADSDNLKPEMYDDFGKFIAEATKLFKEEGIIFKSYSPMNEPDTNYWGVNSPKQEGCHFDPGESQSKAIVETRKALDAAGLADVLVAGMDETDINKTVSNYSKLTDEAKKALGRIDTHTYSGSNRKGAKETALNAGKNLWMSEVDGGWDGFGLAQRIIDDVNGMNASAWVLWDIVDKHKDSNFVDPTTGNKTEANNSVSDADSLWGVGMADHDNENLIMTNKYYAFGQFTKYINPGDTIIASSNSTLAAYNKQTGDIKIVALNSGDSSRECLFDLSAFTQTGDNVRAVRTNSSTEKWKELAGAVVTDKKFTYSLPAKTVTTFIIEGKPSESEISFSGDSSGMSYSYSTDAWLDGYDKYFAVYDSENRLKYLSHNEPEGSKDGDFTDCTPKLMVWEDIKPADAVGYAVISGCGNEMSKGESVELSVSTNLKNDVQWSVDNSEVADITSDGVLTAKNAGSVTVRAAIGGYTAERTVKVTVYTLSGTPSWSNDTSAPKDSDDYTKAADGNLSTYFDGVSGGYVQYDYGEPFKITSVKLAARAGNGMPERTVGGTVQGSNDGIQWTDLYKIKSAIPAGQYTTVVQDELSTNKAFRYYRYTNNQNMTNIAEFLIEGEPSGDVSEGEPVIRDIAEFTDNFEGSSNMFNADNGNLGTDGNQVYASGLARFGNVFVPVKATAVAETETISLAENDRFRLTFNMFAGWENNGKENSFALKSDDGSEIVGFTLTGGGYNLNRMSIGGNDLLKDESTKPIAQCKSNAAAKKTGANGWLNADQPYRNTVGFNKTVEIIISGNKEVTVSLSGGMEDITYTAVLDSLPSIKSIEITGNCNSARDRVTSYDNFDADLITYSETIN
ncbi:hypothetical protein FMM68_04250 [Lachnospiraceae bacterium MD329]|nr:hypothetical protein [Lachnospiraceae bacterium MD329]